MLAEIMFGGLGVILTFSFMLWFGASMLNGLSPTKCTNLTCQTFYMIYFETRSNFSVLGTPVFDCSLLLFCTWDCSSSFHCLEGKSTLCFPIPFIYNTSASWRTSAQERPVHWEQRCSALQMGWLQFSRRQVWQWQWKEKNELAQPQFPFLGGRWPGWKDQSLPSTGPGDVGSECKSLR